MWGTSDGKVVVPPGPGTLLVSTPELVDPTFLRTVILILSHSADTDEGTLGVVLNRPSETSVQSVLPGWERWVSKPRAMFWGGPVGGNGALCVGVRRGGSTGNDLDALLEPLPAKFARVTGELVLVDLDLEPETAAQELAGCRVFAGHSGWGAGQLEAEIEQGSWYVVQGQASDVIAAPGTDVWFRAMRRQRYPLSLAAYQPLDAAFN